MAQIVIDVVAKIDDRTLRREAQDVQKQFQLAGQQAGTQFGRELQQGFRTVDARTPANQAAREFGNAGTTAGRQFADSASSSMRRGDWNGAGRDSAREFQRSFERAANPRVSVDARSSARDAGGEAGDSFGAGFAGAAGLSRLAGAGGPIAGAILAGGLAGFKLLGPQIEAAMQLEASQDLTQARLGLDDATMKGVAEAAAKAFAGNWGASIEANLATATTAIQSGLLSPTADTGAIQQTIQQLTDVSTILGEDMPAVSPSAAQAIRTGIAEDAAGAFDLLVAGQQKGLNASGDLLETVNEYGTQFRKLGLTGPEALGLLSQAVQAGARDTDVAADALKEFSIRAVDGSKTTTEAFQALNLDADEMARRFIAGGRTSAIAFDEVVDKIRGIKDPVEQSRIAVELFGTQAEDLGGALSKFDLSTAVNEFGEVEGAFQQAADKMVSNSLNEWQTAGRNIQSVINGIRDSLNMDDWFNSIPKAINDWANPNPTSSPPGAPWAPPSPSIVPGPAVTPSTPGGAYTPGQSPLDILAPRTGGPSFERVDNRGVTDSPLRYQSHAPGAIDPTVNIQDFLRAIAAEAGLEFTSGVRPGDPGQHGGGFAADLAGTPSQMRAFAETWASNPALVGITRQMIFSDAGGLFNENNTIFGGQTGAAGTFANDLAGHQDHVHLALEGAPAQNGALPVTIAGFDASGAFPSTSPSSSGGSGLGVPLDQDFGLSNGLGGLADNLTRMVGNMAMAPVMGQLSAISAASPIQGGHGLMGVMGAQNIANGMSPLGLGPTGPAPLGMGGPVAPPMMGPFGPATGPAPGPTGPVGRAPGEGGWQPQGGGGIGVGGGAMDAAMMAAGGLDLLAPGAGQAAQTGMKLANRSIQYGGQLAAIGVSGLLETFGLSDSAIGDPSKSWLGRAVAGLSGAKPATPGSAGQTQAPAPKQEQQGDPNDPNAHGQKGGAKPGPTVHIEQFVQAQNRNGQQAAQDLAFQTYAAKGSR